MKKIHHGFQRWFKKTEQLSVVWDLQKIFRLETPSELDLRCKLAVLFVWSNFDVYHSSRSHRIPKHGCKKISGCLVWFSLEFWTEMRLIAVWTDGKAVSYFEEIWTHQRFKIENFSITVVKLIFHNPSVLYH